jgi:hypothetical protein
VSAVAEPMLSTELWVSFVSMLRAYAAAASLNGNKVEVHSEKDTATIGAFAAQIELRFDSESGEGVWEKRVAGRPVFPGTFTMQPDGMIRINGAVKDFDHAAIDLIASVTERGKETW